MGFAILGCIVVDLFLFLKALLNKWVDLEQSIFMVFSANVKYY